MKFIVKGFSELDYIDFTLSNILQIILNKRDRSILWLEINRCVQKTWFHWIY